MDVIKQTEVFLRDRFSQSKNPIFKEKPSERDYRLQHTYRVANIGKQIATASGLHADALVVACLLHDIAYSMDDGFDWNEHGRMSAAISRPFVESLDLPRQDKDDIMFGIAIHVDDKADFDGLRTVSAVSVGDADNIDRFDAYRLLEMLEGANYLTIGTEEKSALLSSQLIKLRKYSEVEFATKKATELWKANIEFRIEFLTKLQNQIEISSAVL